MGGWGLGVPPSELSEAAAIGYCDVSLNLQRIEVDQVADLLSVHHSYMYIVIGVGMRLSMRDVSQPRHECGTVYYACPAYIRSIFRGTERLLLTYQLTKLNYQA